MPHITVSYFICYILVDIILNLLKKIADVRIFGLDICWFDLWDEDWGLEISYKQKALVLIGFKKKGDEQSV